MSTIKYATKLYLQKFNTVVCLLLYEEMETSELFQGVIYWHTFGVTPYTPIVSFDTDISNFLKVQRITVLCFRLKSTAKFLHQAQQTCIT